MDGSGGGHCRVGVALVPYGGGGGHCQVGVVVVK